MNKESNLVEAYQKIERMIQLTSDLFDELVENQGQSIKIHYPEQIICISLVRLKYPDGRCRGVFWEKFHIEGKNLFWRKGWKLENTPASSLVKRMEEGDKVKFR